MRGVAFIITLIIGKIFKLFDPRGPKNIIAVRVFMNKMLEYSARKNKANGPPAYSTLKPETSSDSPSVKSNGVRFVSAKVDTNHIAARGQLESKNQVCSCV